MSKSIYVPPEPTIGDDRYLKLKHKELLDPLRIIHFKHYEIDPSIQYLKADDGYSTMFENGRFIPGSWYLVRGKVSYNVLFSFPMYDNSKGSILITSNIDSPLASESLPFFDDEYISFLTDYINNLCKGSINLILSEANLKRISFGHISLPVTKKGEYLDFIDCATEQLCSIHKLRNIIYIGDDIKSGFAPDEIQAGEKLIESGRNEAMQFNHISKSELESFNERVKQRILRIYN